MAIRRIHPATARPVLHTRPKHILRHALPCCAVAVCYAVAVCPCTLHPTCKQQYLATLHPRLYARGKKTTRNCVQNTTSNTHQGMCHSTLSRYILDNPADMHRLVARHVSAYIHVTTAAPSSMHPNPRQSCNINIKETPLSLPQHSPTRPDTFLPALLRFKGWLRVMCQ